MRKGLVALIVVGLTAGAAAYAEDKPAVDAIRVEQAIKESWKSAPPEWQERLTQEIANALDDVLQPLGVGVVIEAVHLCMMMRGVEKQNSRTITSSMRGHFRDDAKTRDEFLRLAHTRLESY